MFGPCAFSFLLKNSSLLVQIPGLLAQGDWRALIEEDSQRVRVSYWGVSGLDKTVFSLLQNSDDLFMGDTRKPFQEIVHSGPTLEVLEQRSHGPPGFP